MHIIETIYQYISIYICTSIYTDIKKFIKIESTWIKTKRVYHCTDLTVKIQTSNTSQNWEQTYRRIRAEITLVRQRIGKTQWMENGKLLTVCCLTEDMKRYTARMKGVIQEWESRSEKNGRSRNICIALKVTTNDYKLDKPKKLRHVR